jgi:2-keto-3-deoxy-6-phosphogluconate aldolase
LAGHIDAALDAEIQRAYHSFDLLARTFTKKKRSELINLKSYTDAEWAQLERAVKTNGAACRKGDAEACLAAGAQFLVTPWVDPAVVAAARAAGACAMPGALTPTEIRAALAAGADVVKLVPASSAGGPSHVKAVQVQRTCRRGGSPAFCRCCGFGLAC